MPKPLPLSSIQEVLRGLIAQYGFEGPMAEHRLREAWSGIVGVRIAAHTRPDQIRFNKLYLSVDSTAWMQELAFFKPALLEKVNRHLLKENGGGEFALKEIVLRLEPGLPPPGSSPPEILPRPS